MVGDGQVARDADAEEHEGGVEAGEHAQEGDHLAGERAVRPGRAAPHRGEDEGEADGRAQGVGGAEVQQEVVGRPPEALVAHQEDGDEEVAHHAHADDEAQRGQLEEGGQRRGDALQVAVLGRVAEVRHRWRRGNHGALASVASRDRAGRRGGDGSGPRAAFFKEKTHVCTVRVIPRGLQRVSLSLF